MGLTVKSSVLYDTSHRVGPCTNSAPIGLSPFTSLWLVTDNTGTHHVVNGAVVLIGNLNHRCESGANLAELVKPPAIVEGNVHGVALSVIAATRFVHRTRLECITTNQGVAGNVENFCDHVEHWSFLLSIASLRSGAVALIGNRHHGYSVSHCLIGSSQFCTRDT